MELFRLQLKSRGLPAGLSLFCALTLTILASNACLGVPHAPESLDTTTPLDKPVRTETAAETKRLNEAIQPYIAKARAGLPEVKKRFIAGIPKDDVLMLTIRIYDPDRKYEQVFVTVQKWTDKEITGNIASELVGIKSHKMGDTISFAPDEILDWTIEKADGTEEGNFVGNFLNTFK